jgi:hypothetical protein
MLQGLSCLRADFALRLKTGACMGFKEQELRSKQPDTHEMMHPNLLRSLGTANIAEQ